MSEIIIANDNGVEQAPEKKEFYVYADDAGISEARFTNDVTFALNTYLALANFIRSQLRNEQGRLPTLPRFLRDLAQMAEDTNAGMNTEPPAEPEVEPNPVSEQLN